jgi:CRP-like cAMP-binding protein
MAKEIARTVRKYAKDAVIIEEGAAATNEIFYLYRGTCLAEIGGKIVGKIENGEFFGEMAPMLQSHRTATVRALTDCTAFVFHGFDDQNLYDVMSNDPKIMRKFCEQMAIRLAEADRRSAENQDTSSQLVERYRRAVSGTLFVLERMHAKFKSKVVEELMEFLKTASGMTLGDKAAVDPRFFVAGKDLLQ